MRSLPRLSQIAASLFMLYAIASCGRKSEGQAAPPPPEVSIVTIKPAQLSVTNEMPARIEASRVAEVRARVPGIVLKRTFKEGSDVKAGATLFLIDPAQFQAEFNSAEASVQRAEAALLQTQLKAKRYKPLVETNAVSKQEYDDVAAAEKQATADLAAAKAARETAKLSLGYATVTSPIAGRVGRELVTEGALVGQGDATPMAIVQQLDPIYVNMTQSSTEALVLQRAIADGHLKGAGQSSLKVTLVTEDGREYTHPGKLLFTDVSVDQSSGAITLRATFPNPERLLLPSMYVRARVEQAVDENAITVPQQAVIRTPGGSAVMALDANNKVVSRPVTTGNASDNAWVITDGLKEGDRVIVEGLQKVQPGTAVKPVPWQKTTPAANGAAGMAAPVAAATDKNAEQPKSK